MVDLSSSLCWPVGSLAPELHRHGLREPPRSGRDPGNTPPAPLVAAPPDAISRMAKVRQVFKRGCPRNGWQGLVPVA